MAESIKAHGVIEPVVVRVDPFARQKEDHEWIAASARLLELASSEAVPAISEMTDRQALEIMG